MSWDFNFAFLPYGPKWRAHRRLFHEHFHQGVIGQYLPVVNGQIRLFLQRTLVDSSRLSDQIRLFVSTHPDTRDISGSRSAVSFQV